MQIGCNQLVEGLMSDPNEQAISSFNTHQMDSYLGSVYQGTAIKEIQFVVHLIVFCSAWTERTVQFDNFF